jgi:acyl carrier protein
LIQIDSRLPEIVERLKSTLTTLDVRLPADRIEDTTLLFDGGLGLDSFAIIELIGLVERSFAFEFAESDLCPESFTDVITLGRVIARSTAPQG